MRKHRSWHRVVGQLPLYGEPSDGRLDADEDEESVAVTKMTVVLPPQSKTRNMNSYAKTVTLNRLRIRAYQILCQIAFSGEKLSLLSIAANRLMDLCARGHEFGAPLFYAYVYKALVLRDLPLVSSRAAPLIEAFLEARTLQDNDMAGDLTFLAMEMRIYLSSGMSRDAEKKGYEILEYFSQTVFSGTSLESFTHLMSCLPGLLAGHYKSISDEMGEMLTNFPIGASPDAEPCAMELQALCHFHLGSLQEAAASHDAMLDLLAQENRSEWVTLPSAVYGFPVELLLLCYSGHLEECASRLIRGYAARMANTGMQPPFYQRMFTPSLCCEQLLQDELLLRDYIPTFHGALSAVRQAAHGKIALDELKASQATRRMGPNRSFSSPKSMLQKILSVKRRTISDLFSHRRAALLSDATRR